MDVFLIVADRATTEQLNAIHASIKNNAKRGWWHRYTAAWLVGGGTTSAYWRDIVKPHVGTGASVLVFRLPADDERRNWAYAGPEAAVRMEWLKNNYKSSK